MADINAFLSQIKSITGVDPLTVAAQQNGVQPANQYNTFPTLKMQSNSRPLVQGNTPVQTRPSLLKDFKLYV